MSKVLLAEDPRLKKPKQTPIVPLHPEGSREELNDALLANGFARLDDPELIHQMAFLIKDHTHFGEIIRACVPAERMNCYNAMRPYLRFKARAFYEYVLI